MSRLELFLLGPPRIELDGKPVELGRRRALALIIYLAVTGESHSRDTLATMFWPDYDQSQARTDLRRTLYVLNESLGRNWLEIEREIVGLNSGADLWLDVAQFQQLLSACRQHDHPNDGVCATCLSLLSDAVALYHDDFLAGFSLPDSPGFDEWQFFQTESLRQALISALKRLVQGHSEQSAYELAIPFARRWQALDPLHEPVHRHLMQLYGWTGQQAAALRQYQLFVQLLDEELGALPEPETTTLYQVIREKRGSLRQPSSVASGEPEDDTQQPRPDAPAAAFPLIQENSPPNSQFPVTIPGAEAEAVVDPSTMEGEARSTPGVAEEIRIATVLVADMSRPTPLTHTVTQDIMADNLTRLLQMMGDILLKYEAQVDQFLGEGVLAIFGAAHLHEDDPERAIWAALEIREAIQELGQQVTIGINTGEVYRGQSMFDPSQNPTLLGPAINLPARLREKVEVGQIVVGETTYRLARRTFRFKPISLNIEASSESLDAYLVVRPRRRPATIHDIEGLETGLIGRDEELRKLKAAAANVLEGMGQMVTLAGEAGTGKSRLVAEVRQKVLAATDEEHGLLWLEGRCLEMGLTASYWPFIDVFRDYFAWRPNDGQQKRAKGILAALKRIGQEGALSQERLDEMAPLLGNLLSVRTDAWDRRLRKAGPEQIRQQTFLTIHDFFVSLAQQQPVILVFEDLHWADSLSLDLISFLMEALSQAPLMLLAVYRPESQHKSGRLATIASRKCPERFTELQLRELTPQQSRQLVASLLTIDEIPAAIEALILEKSQGNPLFVEEIIRSLIDSGMIYREGERWRASTEIESVIVPANVQSIILSRVDHLEYGLRLVLQCASVIGHLFRRRILAQIVPGDIDLGRTLQMLEEHALIYQERIFPEEEYAFKHVLTQAAVYQTIPQQRRGDLHRRVAETMELLYQDRLDRYFEQLAYHYERTDDAEKAAEYLLKADKKVSRAYLTPESNGDF